MASLVILQEDGVSARRLRLKWLGRVEDGAGPQHKSCLKMDINRQKKTWVAKNHLAQNWDTTAGTDEPVMGRGQTCCHGPNAMESGH